MMFENNDKYIGEFVQVEMFGGAKHKGTMLAENANYILLETRSYRVKLAKSQIVLIIKSNKLLTAINVELISKRVG